MTNYYHRNSLFLGTGHLLLKHSCVISIVASEN